MASGFEDTPYFRRYDQQLVSKPASSLKKSWGGYRSKTLTWRLGPVVMYGIGDTRTTIIHRIVVPVRGTMGSTAFPQMSRLHKPNNRYEIRLVRKHELTCVEHGGR